MKKLFTFFACTVCLLSVLASQASALEQTAKKDKKKKVDSIKCEPENKLPCTYECPTGAHDGCTVEVRTLTSSTPPIYVDKIELNPGQSWTVGVSGTTGHSGWKN